MDSKLWERALQLLRTQKGKNIWLKLVSILGCIVVFVTTYAMILPAITISRDVYCEKEEHTHTDTCYIVETVPGEQELICNPESMGLHIHTSECYDENHVAVCGYANYCVHTHTEACYEAGVLVCSFNEIKAHSHDAQCYDTMNNLSCGQTETVVHAHTDECYSVADDGSRALSCDNIELLEHIHTDACFAAKEVDRLVCKYEEHSHNNECFAEEETPLNSVGTSQQAGDVSLLTEETEEPVVVDSGTIDNMSWAITGESNNYTLTITSSDGETAVIPDYANSSMSARPWLTYVSAIKKIVVSDGITKIGTYAFYNMTGVETVEIADSVTSFGADAFSGCSMLRSVLLPQKLTAISDRAFKNCSALITVTIPDTVSTIGENAFDGCTSLSAVQIQSGVIGAYAFQNCTGLTNATLGAGSIGEGAFMSCEALTTLTLGEGVDSIAPTAFALCPSLTDIVLEETNSAFACVDGVLYDADKKSLLLFPAGKTELGAVPETVTAIGDFAFVACANLTELDIPETVVSIGQGAFGYCTGLTTVTIPGSVETVGDSAFYGCENLTAVTIPGSVETVGNGAFAECASLSSVIFEPGYYTLGDSVFSGCTKLGVLEELVTGTYYFDEYGNVFLVTAGIAFLAYSPESAAQIPESIPDEDGVADTYPVNQDPIVRLATTGDIRWILTGESGDYCLILLSATGELVPMTYSQGNQPWYSQYKSGITSIVLGDGISSVCSSAFRSYTSLKSLHIAETVSSLGDSAFYGCTALETVSFPKTAITIGESTFDGCTSLSAVQIQSGVIGAYAFQNCTGLTNATLGAGSIGEGAFMSCETLRTLTLGEGVDSIAPTSFILCTSLTDIVLEKPNSAFACVDGVLYDADKKSLLLCPAGKTEFGEVPDSVTAIGDFAFVACANLTELDIPETVVSIGQGAFGYCTGLTTVTIPSSVETVGDSAFYGCANLAKVTFEEGYYYLYENVFSECSQLPNFSELLEGNYYADEYGNLYQLIGDSAIVVHTAVEGTEKDEIPKADGTGTYRVLENSGVVVASGTSSDIAWYVLHDNSNYTLYITSSSGSLVAMPNYSSGSATPWSKYASTITSVEIDDTVTSIGNNAFYNCGKMTEIDIPDSVTSIGNCAFQYCSSLTSVSIPDSVTSIPQCAFYDCSSLERVYIPDSVTSIEVWAFYGCSKLSGLVLPESLTSIGSGAFRFCRSLTQITIPQSVTMIGDSAFIDCTGLTKFIIQGSELAIKDYAFEGCTMLESIEYSEKYLHLGNSVFTSCTKLPHLQQLQQGAYYADEYGNLYQLIGDSAIVAHTAVEGTEKDEIPKADGTGTYRVLENSGVVVASGTSSDIAWYVLHDNSNYTLYITSSSGSPVAMPNYSSGSATPWSKYASTITSVEIDDTVTSIGNNAFYNCGKMTEIDIPDSVTSIGNCAFQYCSSLTRIDIPDSVTSIGNGAFEYCSSLTSIRIPDSVTSIPMYAFYGCSSLEQVYIPDSVTSIETWAFYGCSKLAEAVLPESLTTIGNGAFRHCSSLTEMTIPDSVTAIGEYAFNGCSSLTEMTIPDSVTLIPMYAFYGCSSLERVYIPDSVTSIETWAFYGCSKLAEAVLPESLTTIGNGAFRHCSSLTEMTIPDSVTAIGEYAFNGCTGLTKVIIQGSELAIGGYAFEGCTMLEQIEYSEKYLYLGDSVFKSCTKLPHLQQLQQGTYYADVHGNLYFVLNDVAYCIYTSVEGTRLTEIPNQDNTGMITVYNDVVAIGTDGDMIWVITGPEGNYILDIVYGGSNTSGGVSIPNYTTSKRAPWYDYRTGIVAVNIGDRILGIGDYAFYGCTVITQVSIADTVTSIGSYAFYNCQNMDEITIPDGVTSIGSYAFANCASLSHLELSPCTIYSSAFSNCPIADAQFEMGYYSLSEGCFSGMPEESVVSNLSGGTYYVDENGNIYKIVSNLAYVIHTADETTIPDEIPNEAGTGTYIVQKINNLVDIGWEGTAGIMWYVTGTDADLKLVLTSPSGSSVSMANYTSSSRPWQSYINKITAVEVEANVANIGDYAFYNFTNLKEVSISNSVTSIGSYAFYGCSSLTEISVPDSVTSIGSYAFYGCSSLTEISIPDSVTSIESYVFYGCSSLTEISIPDSVTSIGSYAFGGCSSLTEVSIPDSVTSIGKYTFYKCSSLTEINLPESVTSIGADAFSYCSSLTEVNLPESVTSIGDYAFYQCSSLTEVNLPQSLTSIPHGLFASCTSLTEIVLPESVTSIKDSAFHTCSSLVKINLPESITSLPYGIFANCSSLKEIDLPESVTSIGTNAFRNCTNLKEIDLPESVTSIGDYTFCGCSSLTEIDLPESVTSIATYAFSDCSSLKKVNIPKNITKLPNTVFQNCASLETVILDANKLKTVSTSAFTCSNISVDKTVIVDTGVDILSDLLFARIKSGTGRYPAIQIMGPNHFTASESVASLSNLPMPMMRMNSGSRYYVDAQGVIYELDDEGQTAMLFYVPAGITELQIPAEIPADEDGSSDYPVNAVDHNTLEDAADLTTLSFEKPENILAVPDFAFANCPTLTSVNGQSTCSAAEATFANAEIGYLPFHNTGLTGCIVPTDEVLSIELENDLRSLHVSTGKSENNNHIFYTGQQAKTTIYLSSSTTTLEGTSTGDSFRVYFQFSGSDARLSGLKVGEAGNNFAVEGSDTIYNVKLYQGPAVNTYYIELPELIPGDTLSFDVTTVYPSPNSPGGTVNIWCALVDADGKALLSTDYNQIVWETERVNVAISKTKSGTPSLYGDGTESGKAIVRGLSYNVTLSPGAAVTPSGKGNDFVTGVTVTDVVTLGEGLRWRDEAIEAVENGTYTVLYQNSQWKLCYTDASGSLQTIMKIPSGRVSRNEVSLAFIDGKMAMIWRATNNSTLTNGYRQNEFTRYSVLVSIGDTCLIADEAASGDVFTVTNTASAVVHYTHSEDQAIGPVQATASIAATDSRLEVTKTKNGTTVYMGEAFPYTVTMKNYGTEHMRYVYTLEDTLDNGLYISATDMMKMFEADVDRQLTITIQNAMIYSTGYLSGTVTGTDGNEYELTIANTSKKTAYHGGEFDEQDGCVISNQRATVTIGWEGETLRVKVDNSNDEVNPDYTKDIAVNGDLEKALAEVGYFVTPLAVYKLEWNYDTDSDGCGLAVWSGQTITYTIPTTVKDTFMAIGSDTKIMAETKNLSANTVTATYKRDGGALQTISGTAAAVEVKRDFVFTCSITHNGKAIDGTDSLETGSILDFTTTVTHTGSATYPYVPVVNRMAGAEILLVEKDKNPQLEAAGLPTITINEIEYYETSVAGEYHDVVVGNYLAETVVVSKYGYSTDDNADMEEGSEFYMDTRIYWYLTDINAEINYKVILKAAGDSNPGATDLRAGMEAWLNDHQTHRLWSAVGIYHRSVGFRKYIVTDRATLPEQDEVTEYTVLEEGESVTYRLDVWGNLNEAAEQAGMSIKVTNNMLYDMLPKTCDGFRWSTENVKVEYVYDDDVIALNGRTDWYLSDVKPGTLEVEDTNQQFVVWDQNFSVEYFAKSTLHIYITLTYPEGTLWNSFANLRAPDKLCNQLFFSDDSSDVYHTVPVEGEALLIKGVNSTGTVKSNTYYPNSEESSRRYYVNQSIDRRAVEYYVAVYNDGSTRLYLDTIQDRLPIGFMFWKLGDVGQGLADVEDLQGDQYQNVVYVPNSGEAKSYISYSIDSDDSRHLYFDVTLDKTHYDEEFEKYYLKPGEALVFNYYCYIGDVNSTETNCINAVAMPYFDYNTAGVKKGSSEISGTNQYATIKHDGVCSVMNNATVNNNYGFDGGDSSTKWLFSSINLEHGYIVPNLIKTVHSLTDDAGYQKEGTDYAHTSDTVTWAITVRNTGTEAIRDYTLVDVMQHDYDYTGDVTYSIKYGDNYEITSSTEYTLFSMSQIPTDGSTKTISTSLGIIDVTWTQRTESSDAILAICFQDSKAAIPEGGEAVLKLSTVLASDGIRKNTTYVNNAYIIPTQSWVADMVQDGNQVVYDGKWAVQNNAYITVASSYATSATKAVTDKADTNNTTVSYQQTNSIVLTEDSDTFTYTLTVQNSASDSVAIDNMIFIDNLPQPGDHSTFSDKDLRNSEFTVVFADDPNFRVVITESDGTVTTLNPDQYSVAYSTKTEFGDLDWDGTAANWVTTLGENKDEMRSFRLEIAYDSEQGAGVLIPANATVAVSFDATIADDQTVLPGAVAWNSYGYRYSVVDSVITLKAAPLKVGVRIASVPYLVKQLMTPDGEPFAAEQDETFSYVIYQKGDLQLDLDDKTTAQIGELLMENNVEFTIVDLKVTKGENQSETLALQDLYHYIWNGETNEWIASENPWEWSNDVSYIFMELPISNSKDYAFGSIGYQAFNGYHYIHSDARKRVITSENVVRQWDISLLKVNEKDVPLADAWFGLYSPNALDQMTGNAPDGLTETYKTELTRDGKTYYLMSIQKSQEDGKISWTELRETEYLVAELQAPVGYNLNQEIFCYQRPESVSNNKVEDSVTNTSGFAMPKSGGIGIASFVVPGMLIMVGSSGALMLNFKRRKKKE